MFNPKVLKDEVDHSFFDSDYEDVGISKDGGMMMVGKDSKDEKQGSPVLKPLHGRGSQKALEGSRSPRTDEATVQLCLTKGVENKQANCGSEVEDISMASSMSSIGGNSDKVVHTGSDVEMSSMHSKSPNETFIVWSAKDSADDDEDGYHQSQDESEEEEGLPSTHKSSGLNAGKLKTPKKFLRKRHSRTSSEPDTDTDTDSSFCSSSSESCTMEPPNVTKSKTTPPSTSTRMRRSSVGSVEPRERPDTPVAESEDSVTDVTPLSTPDTSPLQSLDLTQGSKLKEAENGGLQEQQQQPEDVPSSVISRPEEDEEDGVSELDKYSFSGESQLVDELVFRCPGGRNRKNYSFSNDEVRRIDRENQRLLRKLSARSRPDSSVGVKTPTASTAPPVRVNHSGLNRQREQQRIERENLAFLKRLESIKPTPGMRRSEQLEGYQRQASYLGNASVSICRPATKKQSSTAPPYKGPVRPGSVVHHTRAASASSDSTTRPIPKSSKVSVPRPAWS